MKNRNLKAVKSHLDSGYFKSSLYLNDIEVFLNTQLDGDTAGGEDVTTMCLNIGRQNGKCRIVSKDEGVFCGGEEVKYFFEKCCYMELAVRLLVSEGENIHEGDVLIEISGNIGHIFLAERVVMNVVQRMSGIATLMKKYCFAAGSEVLVCPTRKTLLGSLDKKACMIGGGGTHRIGLYDAILFKKTHVSSMKRDFEELLRSGFATRVNIKFVECEIENIEDAVSVMDELNKLLIEGVVNRQFVLMFDNISPEEIGPFLQDLNAEVRNKILFEASGGVDLENIVNFARSGVDIISVGALTNGVRPLDFSFRLSV